MTVAYNLECSKLENAVVSKQKSLPQRRRLISNPRSAGSIADSSRSKCIVSADLDRSLSGDEFEVNMEVKSNGKTESTLKVNLFMQDRKIG